MIMCIPTCTLHTRIHIYTCICNSDRDALNGLVYTLVCMYICKHTGALHTSTHKSGALHTHAQTCTEKKAILLLTIDFLCTCICTVEHHNCYFLWFFFLGVYVYSTYTCTCAYTCLYTGASTCIHTHWHIYTYVGSSNRHAYDGASPAHQTRKAQMDPQHSGRPCPKFKIKSASYSIYDKGWLQSVVSLKLQVSFAKEPYKRDYILQKRHIILRSLLIVATP